LLLPDCADLNITSTNIAVINNAAKPKSQGHFALTFPRDSCFTGFMIDRKSLPSHRGQKPAIILRISEGFSTLGENRV
jgi:hypothetical protein